VRANPKKAGRRSVDPQAGEVQEGEWLGLPFLLKVPT
jgi:hypothetical protein